MTSPRGTHDRLTRLVRAEGVIELALGQADLRPLDADRLRAELVSWHRPGAPPQIVLSMRGLGMLSGACVSTLAEVTDALSRVGGSLVLSEMPGPTLRLLKRAGLGRRLSFARSPQHAVRLAQGGRTGPSRQVA